MSHPGLPPASSPSVSSQGSQGPFRVLLSPWTWICFVVVVVVVVVDIDLFHRVLLQLRPLSVSSRGSLLAL